MRKLFVTLGAAVLLLTGCDVYSLPLPGGADTGDDPMQIQVEFRNVLDLVPHSSVKVNDVTVGKVTTVETKEVPGGGPGDYLAQVTVELPGDTSLPESTRAKIRQTSLLGEKFVSLEAPPGGGGELGDGDVIPVERTGASTEVEEVLGALSLVLNGGGVAQMKTIASELNTALEGREDSARSLLNQVDSLMGQLDASKGDIVRALEALNGLAVRAREHMGSIDAAMEELPSALRSIDRQRNDLVKMLKALNRLSDVGVRVINNTKTSTIQALRSLQPVLTKLADSGDALVNSLHVIMAYPIPDQTVGRSPQVARNLHMGDYVNLDVDLRLNFANGIGLPCTGFGEDFENSPPGELCPGLSDLLAECQRNPRNCLLGEVLESGRIEDIINQVLGGLPRGTTRDGGNGNGGGLLGGRGGNGSEKPDTSVPDLLDGLGLGRAAPGFADGDGSAEALEKAVANGSAYDPALVGLLATPLAVQR